VNKLTFLLPLVLPACVSQQQLAQSRAERLAYSEGICRGRGVAPNTPAYLKCLQEVGKDYGYELISDGQQLAYAVPPPLGGIGRPRTFYPSVYVPPVYNQPR